MTDQGAGTAQEIYEAYLNLGLVLARAGDHEEAIGILRRAVERNPDAAAAYLALGVSLAADGQYEQAFDPLRRTITLASSDGHAASATLFPAYTRLIVALLRLDREHEAGDVFQQAVADGIGTHRDWLTLGNNLVSDGHYNAAIIAFDHAIALAPDEVQALVRRGMAYGRLGRNGEALADFNRALELRPDDAWVLGNRGVAYGQLGRHEAALEDLDRALELRSDDAWALANRGAARRLLGRYEAALADFDRALELRPDDVWVLARRGATYGRLGRYEAALADLDRALELRPDNDWARYNRAIVQQIAGEIALAQTGLAAAIATARQREDTEPDDWSNRINLAIYHLAAGEVDEANRCYDALLADEVPAWILDDAVRDLDEYLGAVPDHALAREIRDRLAARVPLSI